MVATISWPAAPHARVEGKRGTRARRVGRRCMVAKVSVERGGRVVKIR
jgi:hypothetical protein